LHSFNDHNAGSALHQKHTHYAVCLCAHDSGQVQGDTASSAISLACTSHKAVLLTIEVSHCVAYPCNSMHSFKHIHSFKLTQGFPGVCPVLVLQVNYLPLLHMPYILRLQRHFKQDPGRPTASSKSPAATPCLALYSAAGQPLWWVADLC
jgi:hypothetical protein